MERITTLPSINARLATLDQLKRTTIPAYLCPVPSDDTLRDWFDAAGISRFKASPLAKRGGGPMYYSVPAVEKFLHSRTMLKPIRGKPAAFIRA